MPISTVHTSNRCHQRNAATDQHQTKLTSFDDYHQLINNRQDFGVVEAEVEEDDGGEYYLDHHHHHYHRHQPARAFGNGGCGFPILHDCVDVNLVQEGDDDVHHNNVAQQEECTASSCCPPSRAHEDERAVDQPPFPLQPRGTANCNTKVVHDDQKMFSWADDDEAWLDSLIKEVNNQDEEQEDEDDSGVEEDPTTQAFGDECQNQQQANQQINVTAMNRSGRSCTPDDCNDDPQDGHCSPLHVAVTEQQHKARHRQQPSRLTDAHPREVTLEELLGLDACVTIAETACQVYYHHKRRVKKYFEIGDTDDDAEEVGQEAKTAEQIWFEEACNAGKNGQRASSTTTQPKQLKNRASSRTTTKFVIGKTKVINNQNSSPASLKENNDDPTIPGGLRLNRTLSRLSNTSTVVHRTVDLYIQWHADRNLLNITRPYLHIPSNCIALIAASVALKRQFSFGFPTYEDFIEKLTPQFPTVFANFHDHVTPFEVQSIETLMAFYCDCSRPTAADILLSSLRNLFTREQLACLSAQDCTSCAGDPQHGCHPAFSSGGVHQLSELLHPSNVKGDPHHPQHRLHQLSVDTFLSLRRQAKVVLSHPFVYKELIATARDATTAAAVPVEKWAVAVLRTAVAHCCPPPAACVVEHCAQHNVLRTAKKGLPPQHRTSHIAAHQPRRSQTQQVLRHEDYEELIPVGVSTQHSTLSSSATVTATTMGMGAFMSVV